jgi:hypothetical protein
MSMYLNAWRMRVVLGGGGGGWVAGFEKKMSIYVHS